MPTIWNRRQFLNGAMALASTALAAPATASPLHGRFLTHVSVVRVNQIEVTPTRNIGQDEVPDNSIARIKSRREAFARGCPEGRMTWAISWLGLTWLAWLWARRAWGPRAGLYAGLAVLTSVGPFLFTRFIIPESILALFLLIALYALITSLEDNRPARIYWAWAKLHVRWQWLGKRDCLLNRVSELSGGTRRELGAPAEAEPLPIELG